MRVIYLDDILVPGKTFEGQLLNLKRVLQRLRVAHLKLSPDKTLLFQRKATYLGHVVGEMGVSTDSSKTSVIRSWPLPHNRKELKRFLGLCSYYRRFVPQFARIARPLHGLAQSTEAEFRWTDEANRSFEKLKQLLSSAPVLGYPRVEGEFIIDTDASNEGLGAVLSQVQDGQERVIAYYSRALTRPETNYCATCKELLAVVKAVKHFHAYLYGRRFKIRSDHASLQWLLNFRHPEGQIARWIETLQTYNFSIEHRAGTKHGNADALSRRPCPQSCTYCAQKDEKERGRRGDSEVTQKECELDKVCEARVDIDGRSDRGDLDNTREREREVGLKTLWTGEELKLAQQNDPDVGPIVECMKSDPRRPNWAGIASQSPSTKAYWAQWDTLKLRNGILYRVWISPTDDHRMQLILPRKYRREVISLLHDTPTSGHFALNKTLCRVRERFYWVGCGRDVKTYCSRCDQCASRKGLGRKQKGPMSQYNVGTPMERIAIDVLGPLPTTDRGNRYLLIAMDYFTKWPEAYAIPNQEAITVAKVLVEEFFCRFGVPLEIHSDQGRNFESSVFREVLFMFLWSTRV